jgi:prepilin-type N-terminal cleavage/methylation domain-containing protein
MIIKFITSSISRSNKKTMPNLVSGFIPPPNFIKKVNLVGGFTLIELMIAIAIVVIISSFILVSVIKSSNDSADSGISLSLANVKAQSGLYYDSNDDSYGTFSDGLCPSTGNTTDSNVSVFYDTKIMKSITDAALEARGVISGSGASVVISKSSCISNTYSFAAAIVLKSDINLAWCVDNSGHSKKEDITPDTPSTAYTTVGVMTTCK